MAKIPRNRKTRYKDNALEILQDSVFIRTNKKLYFGDNGEGNICYNETSDTVFISDIINLSKNEITVLHSDGTQFKKKELETAIPKVQDGDIITVKGVHDGPFDFSDKGKITLNLDGALLRQTSTDTKQSVLIPSNKMTINGGIFQQKYDVAQKAAITIDRKNNPVSSDDFVGSYLILNNCTLQSKQEFERTSQGLNVIGYETVILDNCQIHVGFNPFVIKGSKTDKRTKLFVDSCNFTSKGHSSCQNEGCLIAEYVDANINNSRFTSEGLNNHDSGGVYAINQNPASFVNITNCFIESGQELGSSDSASFLAGISSAGTNDGSSDTVLNVNKCVLRVYGDFDSSDVPYIGIYSLHSRVLVEDTKWINDTSTSTSPIYPIKNTASLNHYCRLIQHGKEWIIASDCDGTVNTLSDVWI